MGLLVTGLQLLCCWRYLAALVEGFESRGLHCLWEMWATAMVALLVGQVAKYFTPPQPQEADDHLDEVLPDLSGISGISLLGSTPVKEGQELPFPSGGSKSLYSAGLLQDEQGTGQAGQEEEEDMGAVKRRAQEEAAAKLDRYRAEVQQLLTSITREASSSSTVVSAALLYRLADQLFSSPMNQAEFVMLGGIRVVVAAVAALSRTLAGSVQHHQQERHSRQQQQQQQEIEELQEIEEQHDPEQQQQQQEALREAAMPALLQASWVLLQLCHGSPACKAALHEPELAATLLGAAQVVTALPPTSAHAAEPVLRNIWWTLLTLCDKQPAHNSSGSSSTNQQHQQRGMPGSNSGFQQQLLLQYQKTGAVQMLHSLLSLEHGPSAGWVAAAQLGLLVQLGHEHRQQHSAAAQQADLRQPDQWSSNDVASALAASAVQVALQQECVTGLCWLIMQLQLERQQPTAELQQQQLSGRVRVLVEGLLHYLLTFHSSQLMQTLIEQQLLGCLAAHSCTRLGRLLVCQLLCSKGQAMMAAIEQDYELDVPLALAQIIPLKLHVRLPTPPQQQQQVGAAGEGAAAAADGDHGAATDPSAQQQQAADDMYTDILACRLLLQHNRLWELLAAFCDELTAGQQQEQQQEAALPSPEERECGVVPAALDLIQHLMSRDLQLQAAQHVRGDCLSDSLSGSASSSRSLDEALTTMATMPDRSGAYTRVVEGLVRPEHLPPTSGPIALQGGQGSDTTTALTPSQHQQSTSSDGRSAVAASCSTRQQVVFKFGEFEHAVDAAIFRKIKHCSKLVHSILAHIHPSRAGSSSSKADAGQKQRPQFVTVLAIPQFTDKANCWVLQCLEGWLSSRSLSGLNDLQAAQLWVAADFLQVDELQVACEDLIAAGFKANSKNHSLAVELCARHTESGGRLVRLLVQDVLRRVSAALSGRPSNTAPVGSGPAAGSSPQVQAVQLLQPLLERNTGLLLPVVHAELRDRLVALCMLNAGLDAEDPLDAVG